MSHTTLRNRACLSAIMCYYMKWTTYFYSVVIIFVVNALKSDWKQEFQW